MDGFVDLLKDGFGTLLPVLGGALGLLAAKGAVEKIEGAGNLVRGVGRSQFGRKRMEAEADALRNKRNEAAYNNPPRTGAGRVLDLVSGRSSTRSRQRRNLRYQDNEASAKAAEAGFGVTDDAAADRIQSIAKSNAQVSAINSANNAKFISGIATGATSVGGGLGAASDPDVLKAINAQQARAVAEEIKSAQLEAEVKFPPDQLDKVREAMEQAIKDGDSIAARAHQNILLNSGSEGIKQFRQGMGNSSPSGEMEESLKRNILTSHGGIKDTAADIGEYATSATGKTLQQAGQDASTWSMADAKLVTQKGHSLEMAEATSSISADQAKRIKADGQLYGKLDKKGREIIDRLAI